MNKMKNIWKSDLAEKISSDPYGSFEKVTSTIQKRRIFFFLDMFFVMTALQRNSR